MLKRYIGVYIYFCSDILDYQINLTDWDFDIYCRQVTVQGVVRMSYGVQKSIVS